MFVYDVFFVCSFSIERYIFPNHTLKYEWKKNFRQNDAIIKQFSFWKRGKNYVGSKFCLINSSGVLQIHAAQKWIGFNVWPRPLHVIFVDSSPLLNQHSFQRFPISCSRISEINSNINNSFLCTNKLLFSSAFCVICFW